MKRKLEDIFVCLVRENDKNKIEHLQFDKSFLLLHFLIKSILKIED